MVFSVGGLEPKQPLCDISSLLLTKVLNIVSLRFTFFKLPRSQTNRQVDGFWGTFYILIINSRIPEFPEI